MASRRDNNDRASELIEATLICIANEGISRVTVRNIACYAGVSNGLIRFYFKTKDKIIEAAYAHFLERIFTTAHEEIERRDLKPKERLSSFIEANLSPPIVTRETVLLWANFLPLTYNNVRMAEIRQQWYRVTTRSFRDLIAAALTDQERAVTELELRRLSMAVNALIDGLWIEGGLSVDRFDVREIQDTGLSAASNILGLQLG